MSKVPPLEASVTVTARDAILQQATEFSHLQWCLTWIFAIDLFLLEDRKLMCSSRTVCLVVVVHNSNVCVHLMFVSFVNLVANIVLHRTWGVLAACSMSLAWQEALHVFFHMTNAVDAVTLSTCMSVALLNINGVKLCNEMTYQLSDLGLAGLTTAFYGKDKTAASWGCGWWWWWWWWWWWCGKTTSSRLKLQ